MPAVTPSPLVLLRERTAEAHRKLEEQIDIKAECADPVRYRRLLEGFYGFYQPLEECLATRPGWDKVGFDWTERAKVGLLQQDLLALGLSVAAVEGLPKCHQLPPAESFAHALGVAYVLEGATLGGRQITGMLAVSEIPEAARTFFASYGSKVGERWKEFCGMLEQGLSNSREAEAAAEAASATFRELSVWLKGRL